MSGMAAERARAKGPAAALWAACRPRQWIKNLLVFVPLISSVSFRSLEAMRRSTLAAVAFTLMASAAYLLNDLADRESDRAHPEKRHRPMASGALSVTAAVTAAVALAAAALAIAGLLGGKVVAVLALYAVFNIAYSAGLRQEPILDVLLVSSGFVMRPVAGAFAIPVRVSGWLFVVSLLLSLTLALLKRRNELTSLESGALDHRPALGGYSLPFLDQLIAISTGAGIISYALYTFQSEHGERLVITLPFFLYGVFRYLYLVYERGAGGSPEEIFLRDRALLVDAVLYLAVTLAILMAKN
ncbi:MAG: decaprenyl-phosphate phosphoribosyltransferase [Acidobacteriia bacterium]|nr:decaprenyl-phosphate phosphoribosyltransferase [Terriglobia bacterium]